ncbi:protein kinase-like protein [Xylariomycetidae sp. FL0641]|nr:protein kinase-like protein [Xylariomycetidae sp. FL0641]
MESDDDTSSSDLSASSAGDTQSIGSRDPPSPGPEETVPASQDGSGVEVHRNMMLASLLEDYYCTRAVEFLKAANPGRDYDRQSSEVLHLTRQLFTQASQVLSSNGLLSTHASSSSQDHTRRQYLAGLDSLVAGTQASTASPNLLGPIQDLVMQTSRISLLPHPANDLQLTIRPPLSLPPRSHYQSSFRQDCLLGKGGFGKVYQCYNLLDQKTYAVKKILLPPKMGRILVDGRHEELHHILREVKAMAMLDHPNIVRYYATWFEEPHVGQQSLVDTSESTSHSNRQLERPQLLLDSRPFNEDTSDGDPISCGIVFGEDTTSGGHVDGDSMSGGIIIGEDTPSNGHADGGVGRRSFPRDDQGWSAQSDSAVHDEESSYMTGSNPFTDGQTRSNDASQGQDTSTPNMHALYIQMSLYPMTLAQYVSPTSRLSDKERHCFHLIPTLRLLLSILEGLQYIHSKGLVHRDIKPGNIFLSSPEQSSQGGYCDLSCSSCAGRGDGKEEPTRWLNPRIGDFGLVTQLAHGEIPISAGDAQSAQKPVGTAYYQPPPHKGSEDEKTDIFALGVVFVEMMCRCTTAMERMDMLKQPQRGVVPQQLRSTLAEENHTPETIEKVIQLAGAMIDPDHATRWSDQQVHEAVQDLLRRIGS